MGQQIGLRKTNVIDQMVESSVIDTAYAWLCTQRRDTGPNNDVWHLRFHWQASKKAIIDALRAGVYR